MPPNVPAERVDAMRRAFEATMKDRDFLAEADKLKIEIDPLSGVQVAALIADIYKTPSETVERVRAAMAPK
jgi:tripartite-type tricarboxylate transporter receptor subunit TctC